MVSKSDLESERHIVAVANGLDEAFYDSIRQVCETTPKALGLLETADVAGVKIGTATLEAALLGTPAFAFYRASALTAAVASRLSTTEFYSMPNILLGAGLLEELLQGDCTANKMFNAIELLKEEGRRNEIFAGYADLRTSLTGTNPLTNIAELALSMIQKK